jgi:hypothetical protein
MIKIVEVARHIAADDIAKMMARSPGSLLLVTSEQIIQAALAPPAGNLRITDVTTVRNRWRSSRARGSASV